MRFLTHNRIQINSKKSFTFTIERTKLYEEKTKQDHIWKFQPKSEYPPANSTHTKHDIPNSIAKNPNFNAVSSAEKGKENSSSTNLSSYTTHVMIAVTPKQTHKYDWRGIVGSIDTGKKRKGRRGIIKQAVTNLDWQFAVSEWEKWSKEREREIGSWWEMMEQGEIERESVGGEIERDTCIKDWVLPILLEGLIPS